MHKWYDRCINKEIIMTFAESFKHIAQYEIPEDSTSRENRRKHLYHPLATVGITMAALGTAGFVYNEAGPRPVVESGTTFLGQYDNNTPTEAIQNEINQLATQHGISPNEVSGVQNAANMLPGSHTMQPGTRFEVEIEQKPLSREYVADAHLVEPTNIPNFDK